MIGVIADCGNYGMGLSEVMSWQSRVTYLSPILFLCVGVGEKVGKIMTKDNHGYNQYTKEEIIELAQNWFNEHGKLV